MPSADAHRRVSVERCKPCTNHHDRGGMPKSLPDELTQYVLNNFTKKSPPYHVTQDGVSAPLQRLEVERMTGMAINRSVVGVGSSRRCDVRDALDWALPSVMGTGDGPPALTPADLALLGWHSKPTPPNQPTVSSDAHWGDTTGQRPGMTKYYSSRERPCSTCGTTCRPDQRSRCPLPHPPDTPNRTNRTRQRTVVCRSDSTPAQPALHARFW